MAIVVFQHDQDCPVSTLGRALEAIGHKLRIIRLDLEQDPPSDLDDVDGLVSMGGSQQVDQEHFYPYLRSEMDLIKDAHKAQLPILGVCLGAQLVAKALGGEVGPMESPEIGWFAVRSSFPGTTDPMHTGLPWDMTQFHAHEYEVKTPPPGAVVLSGSKACKVQGFKVGFTTYGYQYHFEWTRREIEKQLKMDPEFYSQGDADPEAILGGLDDHYDWYRQHSDKLCSNAAEFLFPIDRRRDFTLRPVANYHAAES